MENDKGADLGPDATTPGEPIPIGGGLGTVIAWDQPHIVMAAPDGIGFVTPKQFVAAAGTNITMTAGQDINAMAVGQHATVAEGGAVLFTRGDKPPPDKPNQETGVMIHAASGSVHLGAPGGAINVAADQNIEVTSTGADVLIAAPLGVLLAAAGAAIDMQPGGITLSAPGRIEFRAGKKILTSGSTVTAEYQCRHAAGAISPSHFDDRFAVTNDAGAPLPQRRYAITRQDGSRLSGTTDAQGKIEQQFSFQGERIAVSVKGKS